NSLNRLIRCVCGKKIGPDPRNFNQRVSLGRNDLLIRTFPNYAEAKLLTGKETLDEIADCFLACGVKTVVIKTGKDGCFIKRGDMTMKVPAVAGITAIDTIGAGDNFASGFIAALLEGKNLRECARFANATAAISVLSVGATTGVKNRKLVEQLLEEYEG
ncbi:carbohydrate kinase family protein, partial [Escherichia coli]|uniref:carbohydrate kinase family protein n=1 Tax=Escherichia coli TaxID=562 RepID=UPI003F422CF8